VKKSLVSEAYNRSASQKVPHLHVHKRPLNPKLCVIFCNMLDFYSERLLTPCSTPKLEYHSLLAVHDCLFSIFAIILNICHVMVTLDPHNMIMEFCMAASCCVVNTHTSIFLTDNTEGCFCCFYY
jgi:hypothetical protein